jgi:hypothetical protein
VIEMALNTIPDLTPTENSGTSACYTCNRAKKCFSDPRQKTEAFFCLIKGHRINMRSYEPTEEEIRVQIIREAQSNQIKVNAELFGFEVREYTVRPGAGNQSSGRINVPKDWEGKRVMIVRLD